MNRTCLSALPGLVLAACQPAAQPNPSPVVLPPVAASTPAKPPAVPTFAAPDGVYVQVGVDAGPERSPVAWVRTVPRGVALSIGPLSGRAETASPGGVWRMRVVDPDETAMVTLRPPEQVGAPWRITVDDSPVAFEQRVGPLEARVRGQLLVGQRFVRLDQERLSPDAAVDDAYTHDVITVLEHGLVRLELPDGHGAACVVDALMPLVDEHGVPAPSPVPDVGQLGVVPYALPKLHENCDDLPPDDDAHGSDGVAYAFADAGGRVAGLLVASYMYAEIFVAPGLSRADLARMERAARTELEHQAE